MSGTTKNWTIGILAVGVVYLLYRHNKYKKTVASTVTATELATITEKMKGL